ncbi:MAG: VacB/RNase II family 3'-5' exoribonuclease [Phycisphaerales bacterium]|nr:VacB/RNase II family 3'-5' exoribonuclease [Phycisphaerales bacterium]
MPSRFRLRILSHLRHDAYTPRDIRTLADDLGVPGEDFNDFRTAVRELLDDGAIVLSEADQIAFPPIGREVAGRIRVTTRGFGFVIPERPNEHGDLFIPPGHTLDAVTGDRVIARVIRRQDERFHKPGRSPYTGSVTRIVERGREHFTGTLLHRAGLWFVEPDGKVLRGTVTVRDPSIKNAHAGDKVVFELVTYPDDQAGGEGVIVEVLGEAGQPDTETAAVIRAYGLRDAFPDEAVEQARSATRLFETELAEALEAEQAAGQPAFADREDLRGAFVFTIDPPDAKDFDDAVSIERTDDGFELGVHIADVARFIEAGSPLDEEASARGTSVYLPRRVIPMLPELLSNGICSLQEGVVRFTKSAFVRYDEAGSVQSARFSRSVIQSAKRLTYLEAQALIDGDPAQAKKHARTDTAHNEQLVTRLRLIDDLAKRIRARRIKQGMISLQLPEAELIFNDSGHVVDVQQEDDAFTHTIIEMFMVEANEAVARLFDSLNVPAIRRLHPDPDPGDMEELGGFIQVAGLRISRRPDRFELQSILTATAGTGKAAAVHMAVLRTLSQALYGPDLVGHFALASEHYAHFTSPIRRYPDLTIHRQLDAFLDETRNGVDPPRTVGAHKGLGKRLRSDARCQPMEELAQVASHCSQASRTAEGAERELREALILQLLEKHVGETMSGLVTGVTGNVMFVQLDKYLVDGTIQVRDLTDRHGRTGTYRFDRKTGRLWAAGGASSLGLGDRVHVVLEQVDAAKRRLDLLLDASGRAERAKRGGKQAEQQRGDERAGGRSVAKKGKQKRHKTDIRLRDKRKKRR